IPLPDDRTDTSMPDDFEAMAEAMRCSYLAREDSSHAQDNGQLEEPGTLISAAGPGHSHGETG
ncbi:MAG: hypothetical protein OXK72_05105, partial [Gammaproteobacteria bacterium]|nr:hypothetical protein [Gammaproteobacteria bacterium]